LLYCCWGLLQVLALLLQLVPLLAWVRGAHEVQQASWAWGPARTFAAAPQPQA
jgi:hypothetical protein